MPDTAWLWAALAAYATAAALAVRALVPVSSGPSWPIPAGFNAGQAASAGRHAGMARASPHRYIFGLLMVAVLLHTFALAVRWRALDHGPFTTMHEILSSNLWSLALVFLLAGAMAREVRTVVLVALPVWLTLAVWLLMADARPGHLPPTYATPLLYLHTLVGKLFLGFLLVALALASMPGLRRTAWGRRYGEHLADERRFDELAHRFAAYAFVFDTLMLIVGAVWAQDAWGRYWAWDPLETWAFLSWLALAAALHARATLRPPPQVFGLWLLAVFILAFLTFFGVPFISTVPHKGAV